MCMACQRHGWRPMPGFKRPACGRACGREAPRCLCVLPSPSSQDEPTTCGKGGLCHTYITLHHTESFVACSHNNLSQVFLCWSSVTAWQLGFWPTWLSRVRQSCFVPQRKHTARPSSTPRSPV
ncbi:hypothetical protein F751_2476 [Auxenochlorella protothecoides]|uniref:Uncharacterized protein n=1 Tax=Auxenochlorella protothecoides TaxID=3075 RepID=A0A087SIT0_AUXPR|nr:hypothetical protein F751_2476 [Auxenochlorella protothecoides]KFM25634.1 hypothetical protein F751_2476 [Auxenochlorella protothecoides]